MTEAITRREGVKNGRPILEGSKLSVFQMYRLVCEEGLSPAAVVESYTGVSDVRQV